MCRCPGMGMGVPPFLGRKGGKDRKDFRFRPWRRSREVDKCRESVNVGKVIAVPSPCPLKKAENDNLEEMNAFLGVWIADSPINVDFLPHSTNVGVRRNDTQRVLLPQFYETHLDTVDQRSAQTQRRGGLGTWRCHSKAYLSYSYYACLILIHSMAAVVAGPLNLPPTD